MWRRFETSTAAAGPLPDAAYVELIDMLMRPILLPAQLSPPSVLLRKLVL